MNSSAGGAGGDCGSPSLLLFMMRELLVVSAP
jgi:hypothetical protein